MKAYIVLSLLGAVVSPALASVVARQSKGNLPPVTVKGNAFFAGDERFYVRGVAYQPGTFCLEKKQFNRILISCYRRCSRRGRSAA